MIKFNEQQQKVIDTVEGNIAVIATAGSGKTSTLTYRIKNMVENHNISPSSILSITFSKKAKEHIILKLDELKVYDVNVETFHSLALKIISSAYGLGKYEVWSKPWEKEKLIKDICYEKLHLCLPDDVPYNEILTFIALQKTNMLKPKDSLIYPPNIPFQEKLMQRIYEHYEKFKEGKSYIEFDDFLNMANEILDSNEDILNRYRQRFQYILVDEFQDVSMSQALLLKKLNTTNTMIVGDPLQAIYSFRGGDSKYILNFDEEYSNVTTINLNTNYRCSKDIVVAANQLALSIPDSQHRHYVESIANNDSYQIPELWHFNNSSKEGKWICERIAELSKVYKYEDIAILSRTNAQLQQLETILHKNDIAFDVVDGMVFSGLLEIKLILSYLRLALYENDNESFSYIYNKPNRWLNKKFYEEVEQNSIRRNVSMYQAMFTIDRRNWRFKNGIDEIYEVINYLQNKRNSNVGDLVHYLRGRLNIDNFVTKGKQADDGSYAEQIENLDCFENMCNKYHSIKMLLNDIDDLNNTFATNKDKKVKLSTIHRSKGLEYEVVFIIGCNEGLLPHQRNDNIDDEKRLFYVAITRAKKELYLSYIDIYNDKFLSVSSFIDGIKEQLIQPQIIKN